MTTDREEWLKGPVEGIPALLQPTAHALLQVRKELHALMEGFPDELLWSRPAGVASVGFHLQHLTGVLDRLFTYARGEQLSEAQLAALKAEGLASAQPQETPREMPQEPSPKATWGMVPSIGPISGILVVHFDLQVEKALAQLSATDPGTLTDTRYVGRARIPSTVIGLLMHATEHTTRHYGQLLVTARILQGKK